MAMLLPKWLRSREPSRISVVLAMFHAFAEQGVEEVSLTVVTDAVVELQKTHPIGYEFPTGLYYSYKLSEELGELQAAGQLHHYEYRHDGLLPHSFFRLTLLGREKARMSLTKLPADLLQAIIDVISVAKDREANRWGIFARKRVS